MVLKILMQHSKARAFPGLRQHISVDLNSNNNDL